MELIVIALVFILPLAFLAIGMALVVNAIESVKETKEKYGRK
jgi:hypothetical protein